MAEDHKLHPLGQVMPPPWGTNDGMTQLGTSGLQKGELIELCSVSPLRHFPGPTLLRKLVLEEGDLPGKPFSIFMGQS
jgi:hypothetical protein